MPIHPLLRETTMTQNERRLTAAAERHRLLEEAARGRADRAAMQSPVTA